MKIACLSGKGGAGKTFVAVNLAAAAGHCTYLDCDVEEPNGRLFWKPEGVTTHSVYKELPQFDGALCTGCKKCVDFCRFHALVYLKEKPMLFADVCHSCGGCAIACPQGAITWQNKAIGTLEAGHHGEVAVVTGVLNTGEGSGVPVIRRCLEMAGEHTVIDCPPGSACSVMEAVMEADYCILVAEPTAFGLHNIKMVHELVTLLGKPCGLIVNKETEGYPPLDEFCGQANIPVLARIPFDPELGELIARGDIVVEKIPAEKERFSEIFAQIGGVL